MRDSARLVRSICPPPSPSAPSSSIMSEGPRIAAKGSLLVLAMFLYNFGQPIGVDAEGADEMDGSLVRQAQLQRQSRLGADRHLSLFAVLGDIADLARPGADDLDDFEDVGDGWFRLESLVQGAAQKSRLALNPDADNILRIRNDRPRLEFRLLTRNERTFHRRRAIATGRCRRHRR